MIPTRCYIGRVNLDKTVTLVYCHNDGYPEQIGRVLIDNYSGPNLDLLLSRGDIVRLGASVDQSLFYTDRGDQLLVRTYSTVDQCVWSRDIDSRSSVHIYLLDTSGQWVMYHRKIWEQLEAVLEEIEDDA
jgi:hypothetical protein